METIEAANVVEMQEPKEALEELLREGARQMLQQAIEGEVADYLAKHLAAVDKHGRRLVVGNGRMPQRELTTGIGPLPVKQPRVRDRVVMLRITYTKNAMRIFDSPHSSKAPVRRTVAECGCADSRTVSEGGVDGRLQRGVVRHPGP